MKICKNSLLRNHQRGALLLVVVIVLITISALGLAIVSLSTTAQYTHLSANQKFQAFFTAESGLQYALRTIQNQGWSDGETQDVVFPGAGTVNIQRVGKYFWATSEINVGTAFESRARIRRQIPASLIP